MVAIASLQDFYSGGVSENPVNRGDGLLGPAFACILTGQFRDWRLGDRFWYENPGQFDLGELLLTNFINKIKDKSTFSLTQSNILVYFLNNLLKNDSYSQ
jgi:hypothetical protein